MFITFCVLTYKKKPIGNNWEKEKEHKLWIILSMYSTN